MNSIAVFFGIICAAYFVACGLYIMQSKRGGLDWLGARVRGGVGYWRGRVLSGGVDKQGFAGVDIEQGGGADRGAVGESAARAGLLESLTGQAKRGGALGGAGEASGEQVKEILHGGLPVRRARFRVMPWVGGGWHPVRVRQCLVDAAADSKSVFSIAR